MGHSKSKGYDYSGQMDQMRAQHQKSIAEMREQHEKMRQRHEKEVQDLVLRLCNEKDTQLRKERKEMEEKLEREWKERDTAIQQLRIDQHKLQETHKEEIKKMEKSQLIDKRLQLKALYNEINKPLNDYCAKALKLEKEKLDFEKRVIEEGKKLLKFDSEIKDARMLRLVLYSPTGEGKSALGNRIAGDNSEDGDEGPFDPCHGIESKTQEIKKCIVPQGLYQYPLSVTDQPGCRDSKGRDFEHANNLVGYLRGIEYVHGIVLVKNIQDVRMSDVYQEMLKNLELLLGRKVWKNIIVVFTKVEGRAIKTADEYSKEFTNKIRDVMKLTEEEAPLPVILVSNFDDGYQEPLQKLINVELPKFGKFYCDELHSPFEKLQTELASKIGEFEAAIFKCKEAEEKLRDVRDRIIAIEQQLKMLDKSFVPEFLKAD